MLNQTIDISATPLTLIWLAISVALGLIIAFYKGKRRGASSSDYRRPHRPARPTVQRRGRYPERLEG